MESLTEHHDVSQALQSFTQALQSFCRSLREYRMYFLCFNSESLEAPRYRRAVYEKIRTFFWIIPRILYFSRFGQQTEQNTRFDFQEILLLLHHIRIFEFDMSVEIIRARYFEVQKRSGISIIYLKPGPNNVRINNFSPILIRDYLNSNFNKLEVLELN